MATKDKARKSARPKKNSVDKAMVLEFIEEIVTRDDVPSDVREKAWAVFFEGFGPFTKQGRRPPDLERVWELIDYMEAKIARGLSVHAAARAAANHTEGDAILRRRQVFPWTARQIETIFAETPRMQKTLK